MWDAFMSQEFDDVQTGLAAICYYLYRTAGCPYGDNLSGFEMWMQANVRGPWRKLAEQEDGDDESSK